MLKSSKRDSSRKSYIFSELKSITLVIIFALFIRTFFLEIFYVPTGSMKGSILEGDYIFSTKYDYGFSRYSFPFSPKLFEGRVFASQPTPGDVIIMRPPHNMNERYVKRLIGIPGDKIQIIDNLIHINDKPIKRSLDGEFIDKNGDKLIRFRETLPTGASYFSYKADTPKYTNYVDHNNFGPYYVEKNRYFFLGDNRDGSGDSRYQLGTVPFENLIAKGQFVIFSTAIPLWSGKETFMGQIYRVIDWLKSVRLSRLFTSLYENFANE